MDSTTPTKISDSENHTTSPHVQTNEAIKKHHQDHLRLHQPPPPQHPHMVVTCKECVTSRYLDVLCTSRQGCVQTVSVTASCSYKECLKNHVASIGGHAVDGCGEFMPSSTTSLQCAACGCHRNFHRRDSNVCCSSPTPITTNNPTSHVLDLKLHPLPHQSRKSSLSPSPPPSLQPPLRRIAKHHLPTSSMTPTTLIGENSSSGRKRFRTKFTQFQKEKMICFAKKMNWKMPKSDEYGGVEEFCNEVGVTRGVLKVWMHNNKHTIGKKDSNNISLSMNNNNEVKNVGIIEFQNNVYHDVDKNGENSKTCGVNLHVSTNNGSSPSLNLDF